jgi:hypothetical protein
VWAHHRQGEHPRRKREQSSPRAVRCTQCTINWRRKRSVCGPQRTLYAVHGRALSSPPWAAPVDATPVSAYQHHVDSPDERHMSGPAQPRLAQLGPLGPVWAQSTLIVDWSTLIVDWPHLLVTRATKSISTRATCLSLEFSALFLF